MVANGAGRRVRLCVYQYGARNASKSKKISFPRLFTARRRAGVFRGPSGAFHLVAAPALEKFIISQWGFDIVILIKDVCGTLEMAAIKWLRD